MARSPSEKAQLALAVHRELEDWKNTWEQATHGRTLTPEQLTLSLVQAMQVNGY